MDTLKNELKNNFKKCENIFSDKSAIILSCGPSIEKYKHFIDYYRNKNTIFVVIKTATNYSNYYEDIFFYDPRIYQAHRTEFKYALNKKSLKVLCHDYKDSEFKSEKGEIEVGVRFSHVQPYFLRAHSTVPLQQSATASKQDCPTRPWSHATR